MSMYHFIQQVMPQTIRDKIPESIKLRIRKLFPLADTKNRYEFFKSMNPQEMDENLLRTFIVHYAHILDKITKTKWIEGRGNYYYDNLQEAIKTWHKKNFDLSDDIVWAEGILNQYNKWEQGKKPIKSVSSGLEEKKEKNLHEIIKQRRSIRYFEKRDIEKEKLMKVLEAGQWAPCSGNRQAWKFIVQRRIKGAYTAKPDLSFEKQEWRAGSVIVYVAIDGRLYPEKYSAAMDAAAAIQNMLLMAHNLGIGGCWIYLSELTNQNKLRKKLSLENYYDIYSAILLGYPAELPEEPCRKPFEKSVKFIGFDLNDGDNDA